MSGYSPESNRRINLMGQPANQLDIQELLERVVRLEGENKGLIARCSRLEGELRALINIVNTQRSPLGK